MPQFEPAYGETPELGPENNIPTGIALTFLGSDDFKELCVFIEIFESFLLLNRGTYDFNPEPYVTDEQDRHVPMERLYFIKRYGSREKLTFHLYGDYFTEMLREYCKRSLERHTEQYMKENFMYVINEFRLGDVTPVLN